MMKNDILDIIRMRILSLKMTREIAMTHNYDSLVTDCDLKIKENKLLIKLIEKL